MTKSRQQVPAPEGEFIGIRLTVIDWVVVFMLFGAMSFILPAAWKMYEGFVPNNNYRMSDALTEDYWHYNRYVNNVAAQSGILLIGDSVVWGRYVKSDETLSTYLSEQTETPFWNLGLNGLHPLAMDGLLHYHVDDIHGKYIMLLYNPLWMSSPKRDLSFKEEFRFNHPRLVPQFWFSIPCYTESAEARAEIVAARYMPLRRFAMHLSVAYYESMSLPHWTIKYPNENILKGIVEGLPEPDYGFQEDRQSWEERGIIPQNFEWINPEVSLQWRAFQKAALRLRNNDNTVFVLVSSFNEYIIAPDSKEAYALIVTTADEWLASQGFAYYLSPLMPSELYADASHPTREGYAYLAEKLCQQKMFNAFLQHFNEQQAGGNHVALRSPEACPVPMFLSGGE